MPWPQTAEGLCTCLVKQHGNLGNVKQTNWDPLLRPTRGIGGRLTVDAWAPLDGRNINGGEPRAVLDRPAVAGRNQLSSQVMAVMGSLARSLRTRGQVTPSLP